jgi:hypothetical protein
MAAMGVPWHIRGVWSGCMSPTVRNSNMHSNALAVESAIDPFDL